MQQPVEECSLQNKKSSKSMLASLASGSDCLACFFFSCKTLNSVTFRNKTHEQYMSFRMMNDPSGMDA